MEELYGYDIDGVMTKNIQVKFPYIIISGRTFKHYDTFVKELAQNAPVYIRAIGDSSDWKHSAYFKASIINLMKITEFYEDEPKQADIIRANCPDCKVIMVK